VRFVTACTGGSTTVPCSVSSGVYVAAGGSGWNSISDRNAKRAFRDEDGEAALAKLSRMRIQSWEYKTQLGGVRHLGPVAQDFREAFGLGESETTINSVDADGVSLLAAQALARRTEAQAKEISELRRELAELKALLSASARR
jgi:trimeric autotransporter adhesin